MPNDQYDFASWKMAMAILATMRGVPCMYYGTEILMTGNKDNGHGFIREDFPGGWEGDERSAFTPEGRTVNEQEAYSYVQKLLLWRKKNMAVQKGEFKHFIPENKTYVYFRYTESSCVMVALNHDTHALKALSMDKYKECTKGFTFGKNVITGENVNYMDAVTIPPRSALIIEFKK